MQLSLGGLLVAVSSPALVNKEVQDPPLQFLNSPRKVLSGQETGWEAAMHPDPLLGGVPGAAGWLLSAGKGRSRANKRRGTRTTFPGPGNTTHRTDSPPKDLKKLCPSGWERDTFFTR